MAAMFALMKERGMDLESLLKATNEPLRPYLPTPPSSAPAIFTPNSAATARRPHSDRIQMLSRNTDGLDDLCPENAANRVTCFVRSNVLKAKAEKQWAVRAYSEARETYSRAAHEMLGEPLPGSGEIRSASYARLGKDWDAVDLLGCINGIIECSRQLKDYGTALLWCEEAEVLVKNLEIANLLGSAFEWTRMELSLPEYYFERLTSLCLASDVFLSVGNTACAVHRRWVADEMLAFLPDRLKSPQILKFSPPAGIDILRLRHPDPKAASALAIDHPTLQLQGSWQKLKIRKAGNFGPRTRCGILAVDGKLYVLGGEKLNGGPYYRELWMLDLATLSGWQQLPDFPIPKSVMGVVTGYQMTAHSDGRVFVFIGAPVLATFDTRRRKWSVMDTTFVPDTAMPEWPYARLLDYTMQCVGDRLYVFGGTHKGSIIGTDLLIELHIPSRKWRRLTGTAVPKPSTTGPGPRGNCVSWVAKDKKRIFVLFGVGDRNGAMLHSQPQGHLYSHGYGDLWSWDITAERWTRERMSGNAPSPRGEMSFVYHDGLDKVIFFGGYSPDVPTWFDEMQDTVTYTYYADTYIGDVDSSPKAHSPVAWRQVLTRGFPTYRAQAALVVDSKTGKIYLFGGYKNTTYVPSKSGASSKAESRSYMDLWHLRLDLPGGHFDGVDLEEEARTAAVGPWQRCFACGSTGPWKKCGGACKGRVFFCDSDCLRDGWKEHKEMHGCGKS